MTDDVQALQAEIKRLRKREAELLREVQTINPLRR
jgi:cell division protein FtsB